MFQFSLCFQNAFSFIYNSSALSLHFWVFKIMTRSFLYILFSQCLLVHFEIGYSFDLSLSFWYAFIIYGDVILLSILFYHIITLPRTWLRCFSAAHFYGKSVFWNFRGLIQATISNFRESPLLLFSKTSWFCFPPPLLSASFLSLVSIGPIPFNVDYIPEVSTQCWDLSWKGPQSWKRKC